MATAVDAAGDAYVTGRTFSSDFPTSVGALDTSQNGSDDAFVTKLNPAGSALLYSTFLGGSGEDEGLGIALDAAGDAYVTGFAASSDFPTSVGALDTSQNGSDDAFVTKLNPAGSTLLYSTFLGGSGDDVGFGIAVDAAGDVYVTGRTDSSDFPTSVGAFDTSWNGSFDAFVTKLGLIPAVPATLTLSPAAATNLVGYRALRDGHGQRRLRQPGAGRHGPLLRPHRLGHARQPRERLGHHRRERAGNVLL